MPRGVWNNKTHSGLNNELNSKRATRYYTYRIVISVSPGATPVGHLHDLPLRSGTITDRLSLSKRPILFVMVMFGIITHAVQSPNLDKYGKEEPVLWTNT